MTFPMVMMEVTTMEVHKRKDDDRDGNVQNGNDEEASNNAGVGGDVQDALQGQDNNVARKPKEVPIRHEPEINIPQDLNENLDQEIAPQLEGVVNAEDRCPQVDFLVPTYTIRYRLQVQPWLRLVMQEEML